MRSTIFTLGLLVTGAVVLLIYTREVDSYYLFTDDLYTIQVLDNENRTVFQQQMLGTNLFVEGYFSCRCNYPLKITVTSQDSMVKKSFTVEKPFRNYVTLEFHREREKLNLVRRYRLIRPVFQ